MSARRSPGRIARLRPAALDVAQRELYEAIVGARASGPQAFPLVDDEGGLEGPFNAMLLRPQLGGPLQALGAALRFGGSLPARRREIAILVVAQVWDSDFERSAHEAVGRAVGLSDGDLGAIRDERFDRLADADERAVAEVTLALARRGDLTDEEFERACDALGEPTVFELTTLVGYYATLALQLRVFRVVTPG